MEGKMQKEGGKGRREGKGENAKGRKEGEERWNGEIVRMKKQAKRKGIYGKRRGKVEGRRRN